MGFFEAFNRGLSRDCSYERAGIQVVCSHCGGTAFDEQSAQLNAMGSRILSLGGLDSRLEVALRHDALDGAFAN